MKEFLKDCGFFAALATGVFAVMFMFMIAWDSEVEHQQIKADNQIEYIYKKGM